jgi:5-dehydro-2-deoxygluconokinase
LVELLALPTKEQLKQCGGQENYEKIKRVGIVTHGIKEMHEKGIEPDVWKLEGFDEVKQMQAVVDEARAEGRDTVGIVVLGRGEAEKKVEEWLKVGARVDGVIGFAVGRTIFQKPLLLYHQKQIDREKASSLIAEKYKYFVDLFESV